GVIVSTRKLVYDAGANEEAIKALMQAQHKAVMKDLRKGAFDDKIDQYLGGTPGLEARNDSKARAKTDVDSGPIAVPAGSAEIPAQAPPDSTAPSAAPRVPAPAKQSSGKTVPRPPPIPARPKPDPEGDSSPVIEINVDDDDEASGRSRAPRDT